jgi:hypothetical protein
VSRLVQLAPVQGLPLLCAAAKTSATLLATHADVAVATAEAPPQLSVLLLSHV